MFRQNRLGSHRPQMRASKNKPLPTQNSQHRCLRIESLEDRRLLANLSLTNAYLVQDGGVTPLTDVVVGQEVAVRADWTTEDLPNNIAAYQVEFRIDGVPLRSADDNFGAGFASGNYWWWRSGWYASPGSHTVEVIVDIDNEVVENDESDNSFTFNFTTVDPDFPQLMTWPLETAPQTEGFWTNYVDVDPTGNFADYAGGNAAYNGHNAIDAGPVTFQGQDDGIEIYAALDGVVTAIRDGEFDRQTSFNSSPSNYVVLSHPNGYETTYLHMRRDSVQVQVGQLVSQGDRLGLVGSSGSSTGGHIHFEVSRYGLSIETYYDPSEYWVTPVDYVGDNVYLIDTGITNYNPNQHFWDEPSDIQNVAQQSGVALWARGYYSGLRNGDSLQAVWRRPNGSVFTTRSFNVSGDFSSSGWFWGSVTLPAKADLGTWSVDYRVNGAFVGQESFDVTPDGGPEIRVEEPGGDIVNYGRFTPYDYGTVNVGASRPSKTFRVVNHGYDTLVIDGLDVPEGYVIVDGLPSSLAPGASNSFTVELDTSVGGYYGGQIRVLTNDEDESTYSFAVEGIVTSSGVNNLIVGIGEFQVDEGGRMVANVRRTGSLFSPLTVTLSTDDTSEVTLPPSVSFGTGDDYAQFFFDAPSDSEFDGNQLSQIIASGSGYYSGRNTVEVVDDGIQTGDYSGDGLVAGIDFLLWQRGLSPSPLSSADLTDWQDNYGNSPPTVLSASTATSRTVSDVDEAQSGQLASLVVFNSNPFASTTHDEALEAWSQAKPKIERVVHSLSDVTAGISHSEVREFDLLEVDAVESLFAQLEDDSLRIDIASV